MNIQKVLVLTFVVVAEFTCGYSRTWYGYSPTDSPRDYYTYQNWQDQNTLEAGVNVPDYNSIYLNSLTTIPEMKMHKSERYVLYENKVQTESRHHWPSYNPLFLSMAQNDGRFHQISNVIDNMPKPSNCFTWTSPEGIQFKLNPPSRAGNFADGRNGQFYDSYCTVANNHYSQPYYSPGSVSDFVYINS